MTDRNLYNDTIDSLDDLVANPRYTFEAVETLHRTGTVVEMALCDLIRRKYRTQFPAAARELRDTKDLPKSHNWTAFLNILDYHGLDAKLDSPMEMALSTLEREKIKAWCSCVTFRPIVDEPNVVCLRTTLTYAD